MEAGTASGITLEELGLAARNHAMPLEALRHAVTPLGLHYLLIHFDIPAVDATAWRLTLGGRVEHPLELTLAELQARPQRTLPVTFECAGNGRVLLEPRGSLSQPWLSEAVGTGEWTGTPLAPLLEEAVVASDAVDVVFTGLDRGAQGGVMQDYERAVPIAEALGEDVLLVWGVNRQPLPPQHGHPLRVLVPGWYGMTQVKWLRAITVLAEPFRGWQQEVSYRMRQVEEEQGEPVSRMRPRALMAPPGVPDFLTRTRLLQPGPCMLEGRAWSGHGPIERVEVSVDGGAWQPAEVGEHLSPYAWCGWRFEWQAEPGGHELRCRASDEAGNVQPDEPEWNLDGFCNNAPQRVAVLVGEQPELLLPS